MFKEIPPPVPQWLEMERKRLLSETPIVLPVGVKPPTLEQVAWEQLKKMMEPVQPSNPTTEKKDAQESIDDFQKDVKKNFKTNFPYKFETAERIGVNGIKRIIEKVKQIKDKV